MRRNGNGNSIKYCARNTIKERAHAHAAHWSARYVAWCDYLKNTYELEPDRSCKDWSRLYRLPYVVRDGKPTEPVFIGDANAVGTWDPPVTIPVVQPRQPREPVVVEGGLTLDTALAAWAPDATISGRDGDRRAEVVCPWAHEHTTGDGKAMVFERDGVLGFKCLHAHCEGRDWHHWRRHFDPTHLSPEERETLVARLKASAPPRHTDDDVVVHLKAVKRKLARRTNGPDIKDHMLLTKVLGAEQLTDKPQDQLTALTDTLMCLVRHAPSAKDVQLARLLLHVYPVDVGQEDMSWSETLVALVGQARDALADARARDSSEFKVHTTAGERFGKPIARDQHNIDVALGKLGVRVSYDAFARKPMIERNGRSEMMHDHHLVALRMEIDREFGFLPSDDFFKDVIMDRAHANSYHPVVDYLDGLQWDGVLRVDTWLATYASAKDTEYTRAVGRLMLVAAVRRARQPGCKFDEMMILEGPQGNLKSSALRTLAVRDDWFTDDLPLDADTARFMEATAGKWIVEAGELKGMNASDRAALKQALSRQHDECRLAWGRLVERRLREFVIFGTTNEDAYLDDPTGERRFWPVRVHEFNLEKLRADRDQLWAEAAHYEAGGESIRLHPSLWPLAAEEQDARKKENPYTGRLARVLGGKESGLKGYLLSGDVWKILDIKPDTATPRQESLFGGALRDLGFKRERRRIDGVRQTVWVRHDGDCELQVTGTSLQGWTLSEKPGVDGTA